MASFNRTKQKFSRSSNGGSVTGTTTISFRSTGPSGSGSSLGGWRSSTQAASLLSATRRQLTGSDYSAAPIAVVDPRLGSGSVSSAAPVASGRAGIGFEAFPVLLSMGFNKVKA
jgi:hypothetical protein